MPLELPVFPTHLRIDSALASSISQMRFIRPSILAVTASMLAFALAGCGSTGAGLLDPQQANSLNAALDEVNSAVDAGDCTAADTASARLRAITAHLPSSVDGALRGNLSEGSATVGNLALTDCSKNATTTTTSSSTTSSSTSTSTSTTPTTSTTTTTPTTTTTTTPTTTETTPTTTGGGASPG